jgi:NAD-dependent dihydropyrimidine dehydrogenase PreA subunit
MKEERKTTDLYEQLRQILDMHPSRAPASPHFDEILRILFTPEEIAVAVRMSFRPKKVEDIARAAALGQDQAAALLEAMARKAVIFFKDKDGVRRYGLLPTIPGLFEFPFMKGEKTPMHAKLARLWEAYHQDALGRAFAGSPTPAMRIVPVGEALPARDTVVPYGAVSTIIENADVIGLTHCACRESVERCDRPRETCLIFGSMVDFLVAQGSARRIGKAEAMDVLDRAEAAGLVHTTENHQGSPSVVCNCCSCCCTLLRGITELHHPHAIAKSPYRATVQSDRCTGCGICIDARCPMGAMEWVDDVVRVLDDQCIGCGLCASDCPESAITLTPREAPDEPCKTVQDMGVKILQEKGILEGYMKVMQG